MTKGLSSRFGDLRVRTTPISEQAIIGAAIGARDREKLKEAVRTSTLWAGFFALMFSAVYWLAGSITNILNYFVDPSYVAILAYDAIFVLIRKAWD